MLLARNNYPLSFHVGYINELPTKGVYIGYKFFGLLYIMKSFQKNKKSFFYRCFFQEDDNAENGDAGDFVEDEDEDINNMNNIINENQ